MFFPIDPPATTLDKINAKLRPLLPYFNDGKSGAFWLWSEFIVDSGEGVVFSISHFFLSKIAALFKKN